MRFLIIICAVALSASVYCENCKEAKCPPAPKHYEEFGCTPVLEDGDCCPSRFDCSSLQQRDASKCHYNKESIAIGEQFENPEITASCTAGCYCSDRSGGSAKFTCTHIDCPEFFGHSRVVPGKKCINQYENLGCCSTKTVCGEDLNKLTRCEVNGKTYYEGERIDTGRSCYSCVCGKGYEDKPFAENKHCRKINCNMDLHYYERVERGCIPIYYKTDECCPIDWRCPDEKTTVVADSTRKTPDDNPLHKCTFGTLKMNVGDFLSPESNDDQCTICNCKVPPFAHCIKTC